MLFKDITSKLPQVYNVATRNHSYAEIFLLHYSLLFDRVSRVSLSHPLHIKTRWQCPLYLSPHRWSQIRPLWEVRRCSVDVVAVGDGGSRCAPSSRSRRWRGRRSSAPLFAAVVWADPARPPKRHLAHPSITSCTGPAPQVAACGFSSMRLLPRSPCIVARVCRLVQHHLLVLLL